MSGRVAAFVSELSLLSAIALGPLQPAAAVPGWIVRVNSPPRGYSNDLAFDAATGRTLLFTRNEIWEWDGRTWTHRKVPTIPPSEHTFAYDSNRRVAVLFGPNDQTRAAETWEYDGTDWIQRHPQSSPPWRQSGAFACDLEHGRTILFGGQFRKEFLADTWSWDGVDWSQLAPSTSPPSHTYGSLVHDGRTHRLLLIPHGPQPVWAWDGTDWSLVATDSGLPAASYWSFAYDDRRDTIIALTLRSYQTTEVWEWNGATATLLTTGDSVNPGHYGEIVYDAMRNRIVLAGGHEYLGDQFETWEWDETNWRLSVPTRGPRSLGFQSPACLAFDSRRARGVYYNGITAEWDGESWTYVRPSTSSERGGICPVYDSVREQVVGLCGIHGDVCLWNGMTWDFTSSANQPATFNLFGGFTAYDSWRDIYVLYSTGIISEWNGRNWHVIPTPTYPATGEGFSMAFDSRRGRTVLFGGMGTGNETWEWDGTAWEHRHPVHVPSPRMGPAMAFDEDRGTVVVFGGSDPFLPYLSYLSDTWEWDGEDWSEIHPSSSPPALMGASMVYDTVRHCLVLQGGVGDGISNADTWTFDFESGYSVAPGIGSESGGDSVTLGSFNIGDPDRLRVNFGDRPAEVLRVDGDRVTVRTPPGAGAVDVGVHSEHASVILPSAFAYGEPSLVARYGTVNQGRGDREDVLLVNASVGDPVTRELSLVRGSPMSIVMAQPTGQLRARFALYAWPGEPTASTLASLPRHVGAMVFPPPFAGGSPRVVWNNVGRVWALGVPTLPSTPAPSIVFRRASTPAPVTLTLQGIIEDDGSQSATGLSVTNAVILRVR
ncbi:MAG: hypothetical protein HYR85_27060 [Planctomycetes bacterium]|nr:hypothetical protein [Planctomycetota bacterium]MBI3844777.1 hypothetical protein [Planctomycetota bacterium]